MLRSWCDFRGARATAASTLFCNVGPWGARYNCNVACWRPQVSLLATILGHRACFWRSRGAPGTFFWSIWGPKISPKNVADIDPRPFCLSAVAKLSQKCQNHDFATFQKKVGTLRCFNICSCESGVNWRVLTRQKSTLNSNRTTESPKTHI